jgi:hypothetical protein
MTRHFSMTVTGSYGNARMGSRWLTAMSATLGWLLVGNGQRDTLWETQIAGKTWQAIQSS